jgi:UDP:flavonoid glycosyltransferase YjiC (YdhE family)
MRIVFASLGSLGDLHPLLAVARAAQERGHVAVIAASGVYRDYIGGLGFEFRRIRPDFPHDPKLLDHLFHPQFGPERLMTEQVFPMVRETYADLMEATKDANFLVVGELLYVAPMVAERQGIRWANAVLAPTSFLSACDPCVLAPTPWLYPLRKLGPWTHKVIFWFGRIVTKRWSTPLREFRREQGFDPGPSPVFDGKHSPWLVLALFPKALAALQPDWPARTSQTGFPFFRQNAAPEQLAKLDAFLDAGAPPVVFTLGSSVVHFSPTFYDMAIDTIENLGMRAVLLTGSTFPSRSLPPSILQFDYLPLEAILPRASAVVHQGGIGTCAESLRAGIPSVIVPFGFDQPDNAERLRRLGVASVICRADVSVASMVSALRHVLSTDTHTSRARELKSAIDPKSEMTKTLDAIERVALGSRENIYE